MIELVMKDMEKGLIVDGYSVYAKHSSGGRFIEESNMEVYIRKGAREARLVLIKVFTGRKPHYLPWVEFFGINSRVILGEEIIEYFDSVFEEELLKSFSMSLGPGGRIFVEYYEDRETRSGMMSGFPPPVTRLGFILFRLGFTWFKDWYFPEGLMEGGQKLQGEKPADNEAMIRHLKEIRQEVKIFLEGIPAAKGTHPILRHAVERGERVLEMTARQC
jgi:hypothetical protein